MGYDKDLVPAEIYHLPTYNRPRPNFLFLFKTRQVAIRLKLFRFKLQPVEVTY